MTRPRTSRSTIIAGRTRQSVVVERRGIVNAPRRRTRAEIHVIAVRAVAEALKPTAADCSRLLAHGPLRFPIEMLSDETGAR